MYHLAEGGFLITRFFRKVSQAKKYNYSVHDIVCTRETRFCVIIPREKYLCFFQRPPQAEKWCLPAAGEIFLGFFGDFWGILALLLKTWTPPPVGGVGSVSLGI